MEGCYPFRIDLVFDNDLITWSHDSTRVEKGTYLGGFTEGDSSADYSYEVVHYEDVGYRDSLNPVMKYQLKMRDTIGYELRWSHIMVMR